MSYIYIKMFNSTSLGYCHDLEYNLVKALGGPGVDIIYVDHDDVYSYFDVEIDDDDVYDDEVGDDNEMSAMASFVLGYLQALESDGKVFVDWDAMPESNDEEDDE